MKQVGLGICWVLMMASSAMAEPPSSVSAAERQAFVEKWKASEKEKAEQKGGPVVCAIEIINEGLAERREVWMAKQLSANRTEFSFQTLNNGTSIACAWN